MNSIYQTFFYIFIRWHVKDVIRLYFPRWVPFTDMKNGKDENKNCINVTWAAQNPLRLLFEEGLICENPIKMRKDFHLESTYMPGVCANDPGIRKGSVSFVLSVIIINTRFQLVHATFFN